MVRLCYMLVLGILLVFATDTDAQDSLGENRVIKALQKDIQDLKKEIQELKSDLDRIKKFIPPEDPDAPLAQYRDIKNFGRIVLTDCVAKTGELNCNFLIVPDQDSPFFLSCNNDFGTECRAIDENGDEHNATSVTIGKSTAKKRGVEKQLLEGLKIKGSINFTNLHDSNKRLARLTFVGSFNKQHFEVHFKDIEITR